MFYAGVGDVVNGGNGTDRVVLSQDYDINDIVETDTGFEITIDGGTVTINDIERIVFDGTTRTVMTAGQLSAAIARATSTTFQLTSDTDLASDFTGGTGSDKFLGAEAGVQALTSYDAIDGGNGRDYLRMNVTDAVGIDTTSLYGVTVENIEVANLKSTTTATVDSSDWDGLKRLAVTTENDGGATGSTSLDVTAASTTNVFATSNTIGAVSVSGGKNVTASADEGAITVSGAAGDITITSTSTATTAAENRDITVDGGVDVTVTVTNSDASLGTNGIVIGGTTAASGAVVVNVAGTTGTATNAEVTVTGGTSITVNQTSANAVNTTMTLGDVTITGDTNTTSVTIDNAAQYTASILAAGVSVGGRTLITDGNTVATVADTITTVTLQNAGATLIASSALDTLTVYGSLTASALTLNTGASATTVGLATELDLNVEGANIGIISGTQADLYTTINIATTSAATISDLQADALTTLNFTGSAATILSYATQIASVTDINVTGIGGVYIGSTLAVGADFDGNKGDDEIFLAATTQGITMGKGDDTVNVTVSALGTGGSIRGGRGTDTLVMSAANAETASATTTFGDAIYSFEALEVGAMAAATTIDMANLDDIDDITIAGGLFALTLNNLASDGTLTVTADMTSAAVGVVDAATGTADIFNLVIEGSQAAKDVGTFTVADVETINITSDDTGYYTGATAIQHTVALVAASATAVVVTGDAGLDLDLTGSTAILTVDTSGITVGDVSITLDDNLLNSDVWVTGGDTDTTVDASAMTVGAVKIVTGDGADDITGGAGNDTLRSGDGDDTIVGGAGDDTIRSGDGDDSITGGAGSDRMVGGDGIDTYVYTAAADSTGANIDTITNFDSDEDVLDFNAITGGTGSYVDSASSVSAALALLTGTYLVMGFAEAVFSTSNSTLYVDLDGDGSITSADLEIVMTGVTALTDATNFVW